MAVLVAELWPHGVDSPLDVGALERVARDYARRGDDLRRLLRDLERVLDVLGLEPGGADVSTLVEQSAVAWSDAFLGEQADPHADPHAERQHDDGRWLPPEDQASVVVVRLRGDGGTATAGPGEPLDDDLALVSVLAAQYLPGSRVHVDEQDAAVAVVLAADLPAGPVRGRRAPGPPAPAESSVESSVAAFALACTEHVGHRCLVSVARPSSAGRDLRQLLADGDEAVG